jgi:fluoride exporter
VPEISLISLVWVFLGGGLGSALRFAISKITTARFGELHHGTLAANLIGCLLAGIAAVVILERRWVHPPISDMFLAGFLGGLTTFSAMILDAHRLYITGEHITAISYVLLNLLVGFMLFALAFALVKQV